VRKIDIHCHVLPGLDDGAVSMTESLGMIRLAMTQGTQALIATPHHSMQYANADPERVRTLCRRLEEEVRSKQNSRFAVYPGQEIFYTGETLRDLDNKKLLTLADSRYVLVEFWPAIPYSQLYRAVREMVLNGYHPVIAHVERYCALHAEKNPEDLAAELTEEGALIQMNYGPVGGPWYDGICRWCRKMLKMQMIHFLGTDMHHMQTRGPQTEAAEKWMGKNLEKAYIQAITYGNVYKYIICQDAQTGR